MPQLYQQLKNNPLILIIAVAILLFLATKIIPIDYFPNRSNMNIGFESGSLALDRAEMMPMSAPATDMSYSRDGIGIPTPVTPSLNTDRMIVRSSSISVLVTDVTNALTQIQNLAGKAQGFMVNSSINHPEGASSGSITIRIPSDQLDPVLQSIRQLGVRVTYEDISGYDITDQYEDLTARLQILEATKNKFQTIFDQATEVSDLLQVQQQLTNIQYQIDSVKGQQLYHERTAELATINVNLSTDELALPYAPDNVWRPQVVFKQAVRELIGTLRGVGDTVIWLAVYAVVWAPVVLVFFVGYRVYSQRRSQR